MPVAVVRPFKTALHTLIHQGPVALLGRIANRFLPNLAVSRLRCLSQYSLSGALSGETVVCRPAIGTEEQLADVVARCCWYLGAQHVREFRFYVADDRLASRAHLITSPDTFDPHIKKMLPAFIAKSRFIVDQAGTGLTPSRADGVMLYFDKEEALAAEQTGSERRFLRRAKKRFVVDPIHDRNEGANYTSAAFHLTRNPKRMMRSSAERFRALQQKLGHFKTCNVIATGPSFAEWPRLDYSDSLTVICNSAVSNEELMQHARPQILVFADPIFHFGPSEYAARFRESLRSAARRHDFAILIPFKYLGIMDAAMPELSDRVIGVPFETLELFNTDLRDDFRLRVTANVLTFLMLPIATTFADEVVLIGCDGRPMSDSGYFWKHASTAQFSAELQSIRITHRSFFEIDYNDYYSTHCDLVAQFIDAAEGQGKRIFTAAPSHVPALSRRERPPLVARERPVSGEQPVVPDLDTGLPRVLVVDPTPISSDTATGQLKGLMFSGYPGSSVLQIVRMRRCIGLNSGLRQDWSAHIRCPSFDRIRSEVKAFRPDVMYFRSTGDPVLDQLAARLMAAWPCRVVVHVMDDWISRMRLTDAVEAQLAEARLRLLLGAADERLSISEDMSIFFELRYGLAFTPLANGVPANAIAPKAKQSQCRCIIRYLGSLAADMNRQAVSDVAAAVNALADPDLRLEIFTAKAWLEGARSVIEESEFVRIYPAVATKQDYWNALYGADVLLIAYNFDEVSQAYTRHSFANKLPECLASGAALLGYGPPGNATVDFIRNEAVGLVVQTQETRALKQAIRELAGDTGLRCELAERALRLTHARFQKEDVVAQFQEILRGDHRDAMPAEDGMVAQGGRAGT